MLTEERFNKIMKLLEEKRAVTVAELTEYLKTSESTIRRDLAALDQKNMLRKVHGGATRLLDDFVAQEIDIPTKVNLCTVEKERIARYAAGLIRAEDFIYLDAGTTTEKMIPYIEEIGAVYVTNGITHARKLVQKGCRALLVAGEFKLSTEAIVGPEAVESLKRYNFTKCFLGTNGVSREGGFSTPDRSEAYGKMEAVKRSREVFVLADHTKFSVTTAVTFAKLSEAVIITDRKPEEKYLDCTNIREA